MYKFIAKSDMHISVLLKSGKSAHITFASQTGKGSVYYTNDPDIYAAMKRHPKFGRLFKEVVEAKPAAVQKPKEEKKAEKAESSLKKVTVTDLDDAKDYLSERFGSSRTKLRTRKAIIDEAARNNIEFVGL